MTGSCIDMTVEPWPNAARRNVSFPSPILSANSFPMIARTFAPSASAARCSCRISCSRLGLHEHRPRNDAAVGDPERLAHLALGAYRLDVVLNAVEEPAQLAPGLDAHELAELRGDLGEVSHADALLDGRQLARPLGRDFLGLERGAVLRLQIVEILHAAVELDVVLGALLVGGVVSGRGGLQRAKLGLRLAQLDLGFGALKHGSLSSRVP